LYIQDTILNIQDSILYIQDTYFEYTRQEIFIVMSSPDTYLKILILYIHDR